MDGQFGVVKFGEFSGILRIVYLCSTFTKKYQALARRNFGDFRGIFNANGCNFEKFCSRMEV